MLYRYVYRISWPVTIELDSVCIDISMVCGCARVCSVSVDHLPPNNLCLRQSYKNWMVVILLTHIIMISYTVSNTCT